MLAYVFWHWPDPAVNEFEYEERLRAFHRALAEHPSAGFGGSASFGIPSAPWLAAERGYEDWYRVADFASLGILNEAAVSGARQEPHDQSARLAAGGIAGVYKLIRGGDSFPEAAFAAWLQKPRNLTYAEFYDQLAPWTDRPRTALWQRQMTLGPATEFCLHSPIEPAGLGTILRLRPVFI